MLALFFTKRETTFMPTPRSEAIHLHRQYDEQVSSVTSPETSAVQNRIDHYAALGVILDESIEKLAQDNSFHRSLQETESILGLRRSFEDRLSQSVLDILASHSAIHANLSTSQHERHLQHPHRWPTIEQTISAGSTTAVNTMEAVHEALSSMLGVERASDPDNDTVIDKIAKLSSNQSYAYRLIYLEMSEHHDDFLQHLDTSGDHVIFRRGLPQNALIPAVFGKKYNMLTHTDLLIDGPTIQLSDVEPDIVSIGCPITFNNDNIKTLWRMYAPHARRLRQAGDLGRKAILS